MVDIIFAACSLYPVNAKLDVSYVAIKTDHNYICTHYISVLVVVGVFIIYRTGVQHFSAGINR